MNVQKSFFRFGFLLLAIIFLVPCASAWTFGSWSGPSGTLRPGDPVSAAYTVSFNSYDTGKTFESDDSLVMYTDLSDPHWIVTMTETVNEAPQTTTLADRKTMQVVIDGWSLSFSRKQFYVTVKLTGTVPALNQSKEITIVRLQERSPDAQLVKGTQTKKMAQVAVPTPEPTEEPTVMAEDTVVEVTLEPMTTVTTIVPTKKHTYSPGPDPLLVCGLLAGLVLAAGWARRRK